MVGPADRQPHVYLNGVLFVSFAARGALRVVLFLRRPREGEVVEHGIINAKAFLCPLANLLAAADVLQRVPLEASNMPVVVSISRKEHAGRGGDAVKAASLIVDHLRNRHGLVARRTLPGHLERSCPDVDDYGGEAQQAPTVWSIPDFQILNRTHPEVGKQ